MTNVRGEFFPLRDILEGFSRALESGVFFDVATLVGEGEPTLYSRLGELIQELKKLTEKPLAVITNGALLYEESLRIELSHADIVLPSLDSFDERSFRMIHRPCAGLNFQKCFQGLIDFSNSYSGELWIETMLLEGFNDDNESLMKLKELIGQVKHSRLFINTPVRPPAEENVRAVSSETMETAVSILGGISIDQLVSEGFYSSERDDYQAILGIIRRHPMNQFEIGAFLKTRRSKEEKRIFCRLNEDSSVLGVKYKGIITYRLR